MATVTLSVQAIESGVGFQQSIPIGLAMPSNVNAAPPSFATLQLGNNQVLAPTVASGLTVAGVLVIPPTGSSNSKVFSGTSGGTGFTSTALPFVGGVAAGGSFWIASAGVETVQLVWV